jgi:DNA (cytosine-5)-methyltransferase 1
MSLKIFEMFSGYGGASFALKKARIPFECVGYSEIDKYAVQCYEQNHYEECDCVDQCKVSPKNYGDCTKINPEELPDFDLLTGGFPCQSFSVAGKGLGEQDTRGTLFHDIIRIAEVKRPKYILLENVKGLTFKNHAATFKKILNELERIGYLVEWKVLNSKEHGIPQNRERVFFVCHRQDLLEDALKFKFPEKEELHLFLKDILEEEVDEKYYLKNQQIDRLLENPKVSYCLDAHYYKGTNLKDYINKKRRQLVFISSVQKHNSVRDDGISNALPSAMGMGGGHTPMILDLYNHKLKKGICPTLTEPHHNNLRLLEPFIPIKNATKKGYIEGFPGDGVNLDFPKSNTRRGRVIKNCCGTLQCNEGRGVITNDFRIRKLTPTECFRLMGFLDDEINLEGLSNTQQYKLAGNGWDINLVSKIFKNMFANYTN